MKGFLIDPAKREITEVDVAYEEHGINAIYELIGADFFDCVIIDRAGNTVYVDDEGLINTAPAHHNYFGIRRVGNQKKLAYHSPLQGKGLILGSTRGDTKDCTLTLDQVRKVIGFLDRNTVQMLAAKGIEDYSLAITTAPAGGS